MTPADRSRAICATLAAAVMVSAVAAVYAKHKSRKLFVELQTLTAERDAHERLMVMLADQVVTRLLATGPKPAQ